VTEVSRTGVPDDAYGEVRRHFDEVQVVSLTMAIITINGWNRLAITFRAPFGTDQPLAAKTS
jgi:alkylhydroperoxidase family enzyme